MTERIERPVLHPMRKIHLLLLLGILAFVRPGSHAASSESAVLISRLQAEAQNQSNAPAQSMPAARKNTMDAPTRTKASFLAGGGLIVLTLLGLGAALALVRAFRR